MSIHTWESVALSDQRFRRDALLTIKALARLASEDGYVRTTKRSMADALLGTEPNPGMSAHDPATDQRRTQKGWEMAAGRAIKSLSEKGYLSRLNPDAPRREAALYMLTIPAPMLIEA